METYEEYRAFAREAGAEAFLARHGHPFLVVYDPLVEEVSALETGKFSAARLVGTTPEAPKRNVPVFAVAKGGRVGNLSPDMITLGRASNNDLVLRDDQISNFHAYFTRVEGSWYLSDAESSNGTRLEGTPIGPATQLGENTAIAFGTIRCRFLLPDAFFRLLTAMPPA